MFSFLFLVIILVEIFSRLLTWPFDHVTPSPSSLQSSPLAGYNISTCSVAPIGTILHPNGTISPKLWGLYIYPATSWSIMLHLTMENKWRWEGWKNPQSGPWTMSGRKESQSWLITATFIPRIWLQTQPAMISENHKPSRHSSATQNSRFWNAETSGDVQTQSFKTQTAATVSDIHTISAKKHGCSS